MKSVDRSKIKSHSKFQRAKRRGKAILAKVNQFSCSVKMYSNAQKGWYTCMSVYMCAKNPKLRV
jgi:hypothetical protein